MKISPAVKVGLLTITSLIIFIFGIMWLKGRALSSGVRIDVIFNDVDGMRPGSAVQMMGLRVGQIEEITPYITPEKSFVKVKFVITEPNIKIPTASEISIQQSGIIGEKFIEVTPPRIHYIFIAAKEKSKINLHQENRVELPIEGNYIDVGKIKTVQLVNTKTLPLEEQTDIDSTYAYKIGYIITTPGLTLPEKLKASVAPSIDDSQNILKLDPPIYYAVQLPEVSSPYTIVEPIRLKEFFDLQLSAAKSLNETNNKINTILSEDSIMDLKITMKNIKHISAKANDTLDKANLLIESSRGEIETIVSLADNLADKIGILADSVSSVIGDPEFKSTLISTTQSINKSSKRLSEILSDEKTKQTLLYVNETTRNLSELSDYINTLTKDKTVTQKISNTVDNLNNSLVHLSSSLEQVEYVTGSQEDKIKRILDDTAEISRNLKQFSCKLNKRFLLLRLMF